MKIYKKNLSLSVSSFPHYDLSAQTNFSLITMENDHGLQVDLLNYGCTLWSIRVPDRSGLLTNILLSFTDPQDYFNNPAYLGCLLGRTAGRIGEGSFILHDQQYTLVKNYGTTSAHGGQIGFDKYFFDDTLRHEENSVEVVFSRQSSDMEEGYPGNLEVTVSYRLTNDNDLIVSYGGLSDTDTLLNMTNHSYFNLHGDLTKSITSHHMQMDAISFAKIFSDGVVTGELGYVYDSPFDFRQGKPIGKDLPSQDPQLLLGKGYDHFFFFNARQQDLPQLSLYENNTGIAMELFTDCDGAVVYSQNYPIANLPGKNKTLPPHRGLAIEPAQPPIGKKGEFLERSFLEKNHRYRKTIRYHFSTTP